jgi:hypothetical protein
LVKTVESPVFFLLPAPSRVLQEQSDLKLAIAEPGQVASHKSDLPASPDRTGLKLAIAFLLWLIPVLPT